MLATEDPSVLIPLSTQGIILIMQNIIFTMIVIIIIDPALSQYHIQRVNPFKQLSETLQSLQVEGCDGSVLYLTCPTGTKVITMIVSIKYQEIFSRFLSSLCIMEPQEQSMPAQHSSYHQRRLVPVPPKPPCAG